MLNDDKFIAGLYTPYISKKTIKRDDGLIIDNANLTVQKKKHQFKYCIYKVLY